ncbi:MAG: DUF4294 domain-containing protein [Alistipes sp.]|nr:DUF4294 domain-containing protein [Alistipes sp.]
MKRTIFITALLWFASCVSEGFAQGGRGFWHQEWTVENGDSIATVHILPVYKYSRPVDLRRYQKLVRAVKKVYPIARTAREEMRAMEDELCRLPTKAEQRRYVKGVEERIKNEYTPVLKKMTSYEGKILVKLIDRETEYTAYEIVKDFRGGFVAGFWQGIARLFGQNLKTGYDKTGEDKMIEQIIIYYELGWI